MKKTISLLLVICFLICLFPTAFATNPTTETPQDTCFKAYTAIGDSICAGFSQNGYHYDEGFELTDKNINDSPASCYAMLAGKAFGSETYNLGKCGCNTVELLDILARKENSYHGTYLDYIGKSDLITLEIGSNDLLMAVVDKILLCVDPSGTINHQQSMKLVDPLMRGDINGICNTIETLKGIELGPEQILAIKAELSETKLNDTLGTAFGIFQDNLPSIIDSIKGINPTTKFVILNYYNPYKDFSKNDKETVKLYGETTEPGDGTSDVDNGSGNTAVDSSGVDAGSSGIEEGSGDTDVGSSGTDEGSGNTGDNTNEDDKTPKDSYSEISNLIQYYTDEMNKVASYWCNEYVLPLVDISNTPTNGVDPHPTAEGHQQIAQKIINTMANTVTANAELGGTISPDGINTVKEGGEITFTIKPADGYDIRDVLVDGVSEKIEGNTYTFKSIVANHTIKARFWSEASFKTYTALGDSITAGYALEGYNKDFDNPPDCYVKVAAGVLGVKDNYNDALLGYKVADLTDALTNPEHQYNPKFLSNLKSSDLITVDIGSNDLTMTVVDILLECLGKKPNEMSINEKLKIVLPILKGLTLKNLLDLEGTLKNGLTDEQRAAILKAFKDDNLESRLNIAFTKFKTDWDQLISTIRTINPNAKIVVLGYYNPFPKLNINYEDSKYYIGSVCQTFINAMNAYISKESEMANVYTYVSTEGIELYTTSSLSIDPHPTVNGHAEIARRLVDTLHNITPNIPVYTYTPTAISYYSIEAKASEGGSITPSGVTTVMGGSDKEFIITPIDGYIIDYIMLDDKKIDNTNPITIKNIQANHSIYVAFKDDGNPFTDIKSTDWFYKEAMYMYGHKIMKGTSETTFGPNAAVSRAMIVAILYRMENEPSVTNKDEFTDVAKDKWYTNAVLWAAEKGILKGYGNGKLGPEDEVTREQIVNILYQYAVYKGYNTSSTASLSGYTDTAKVSDWANTAMQWAVKEGLINGKNNQLDPVSTATRAEIIVLIYRFIEKFSK